jgi:enoyl-CoA hydratase/carnithine racemase
MDSSLEVAKNGGVVHFKLTHPASRNALSSSLCSQLQQQMQVLASDEQIRILVLQGSGGSFASGADIAELERLRSEPDALRAMYRQIRSVQEQLYRLPQISIAAIDGFCLGAGLSLALACDLRVASSGSVFAAPPARLGLLYSDTELWRLMNRIGAAAARDLLFTGRRLGAAEALRLRLIDRLAATQELEACMSELLQDLQSCSPFSQRRSKRQLLRLEAMALDSLAAAEHEAEDAFFEADAVEGLRAFLERRSPRFRS